MKQCLATLLLHPRQIRHKGLGETRMPGLQMQYLHTQ
jgi:hypothetical protein